MLDARTGTCNTLKTKGQPWDITGPENFQLQTFRAMSTEISFCSAREDSACLGTVGKAFKRREVCSRLFRRAYCILKQSKSRLQGSG